MIIQGENYTKADIIRFMQGIVMKYRNSEIPFPCPGEWVMDLLSHHPNFIEKCGNGVKRLLVREGKYNGFCIIMERLDGTEVDISWRKKALGTKKVYLKDDVNNALRTAIKDQKNYFRNNFFENNTSPKCRVTKELLTKNDCHVNHVHPFTFQNLVTGWLSSKNLEIADIKIKDCEQMYEMDDCEQLEGWQSYHLENAVLEILSIRGNLSLGNRN